MDLMLPVVWEVTLMRDRLVRPAGVAGVFLVALLPFASGRVETVILDADLARFLLHTDFEVDALAPV